MTPVRGYAVHTEKAPLEPFTFQRRDLCPNDVRIDILYCGVCHSDLHTARGDWDGLIYPNGTVYPCVPGHEIVGRVTAVGDTVTKFKEGDLDWPDELNPESGTFVYYGDNKKPGHELHKTPRDGNLILRSAFEDLHHGRRTSIPPFFIFTKGETGRDVVFRALEQVKTAYIAERASPGVRIGKIFTVCADLKAERWPFAPSSFSAIVCIHFAMIDLVPCLLSSLFTARGRHVYVETFGGQGENFRVLPKAGQLRDLFSRHVEFKYYKERQVGPTEFNSVSVTLFAQKQYERGRRLRQSFQDVVGR